MDLERLERKRQFTGLEAMQEEKQYRYSLCRRTGGAAGYCISVSEWKNGEMYTESRKNFITDSEQAKNVLQLLYENAVAPVHLPDIMDDLKFQGDIAMQG
ncbi:MAG: DUF6514 family protein [Ruthenibacterium sp.]